MCHFQGLPTRFTRQLVHFESRICHHCRTSYGRCSDGLPGGSPEGDTSIIRRWQAGHNPRQIAVGTGLSQDTVAQVPRGGAVGGHRLGRA